MRPHHSVGKTIGELNTLVLCSHRPLMSLTRSMLTMAGVNSVSAFESPVQALNYMISYPIDLVMLDGESAPIPGLQFVKAMRHNTADPLCFIPAIISTCRPTPYYVNLAMKAGAQLVLNRPFSTSILRDRLLWILNDKRQMYLKNNRWRIDGIDELLKKNAQNQLLPVMMSQLGLTKVKDSRKVA